VPPTRLALRSVACSAGRAVVTLCVVAAVLAPGGSAASAPTVHARAIATYCSASGDVCYGIFKRSRQITLRMTTAARYFDRYTLCVTRLPRSPTPEHARRCGAFPVFRQSSSTWGSSVNFARQFVGPAAHPLRPLPGRYRVEWRNVCASCNAKARRHNPGGPSLGPALTFRLSR
jgi:hypothetical protein